MDPLAKAAQAILEPFETLWPIDLREHFSVNGAKLFALRNALKSRLAVNLLELALAYPCPDCGAEVGKHCVSEKHGGEVVWSHNARMKAHCTCGHRMRDHTTKGAMCTRKDRTGRVNCTCRCFEARP